MKVLGRAYKENLVLGITMAIVAIGLLVALGIILFDATIARIIISSFFFAFAFIACAFFLTLIILQLLTSDDVILFDENEGCFIVNGYRRKFEIALNDLNEVKFYNKGFLSFGPFIFKQDFEYGKICFKLMNGKKIITPNINNVKECHLDINILIVKNRENMQ